MKRIKIIFMAVLMFVITGCTPKQVEPSNSKHDKASACEIYYIETVGHNLKYEVTNIEDKPQETKIMKAFEKMKNIENNEERSSAVPENLELNSVKIDSGIVSADFNSAYRNMTPGEELIFRTAITYTFTSFDFADYVSITIDGKPLKMTNGQNIVKFGRDDILLDGNISAEPTNYEIISLYFMSFDDDRLGTEIREVEVNPNQPIERYVVEQLIAGTNSPLFENLVPSDTKIREISTVDGVCYVDLSNEFITKQNGNTTYAIAAIYSIVNSLAELEYINKVQFLIDGEKVDSYKNIMDLSKPIEPIYDISFE